MTISMSRIRRIPSIIRRPARSASTMAVVPTSASDPYAIVIVVAAAVGVLFWSAFSGEAANMFKHGDRETVVASTSATTTTMPSSTSASESESPSQSASASASESPSPSQPSESPSQSPNEEQTPEQKVNLDASISVINGTATNGYAAGRRSDCRALASRTWRPAIRTVCSFPPKAWCGIRTTLIWPLHRRWQKPLG